MNQDRERKRLTVARERAILVACLLPGSQANPHDPLDELRALAETAGAVVVDEVVQRRSAPDPAVYVGTGKVQEIAQRVRQCAAEVVIFDNDLSPRQIANIEEIVGCKVLDRSELILDIFARRARTREACLQVELAQLEYTYPRLRAMWSHLERIVGGAPTGIGTRGPGEQQLEIDRRLVQQRIIQLRREIRRIQARKAREVAARTADFFTVGLVGYTNAGKSTLFNALTAGSPDTGDAYADDKLFATLSTLTRAWDLGGGEIVLLSDTVGFIRDLPHHLVASFRATLEEALRCDLLLIVLDVSDPRCLQQLRTVEEVLREIGLPENRPRLLLLNKIDRLDQNAELLLLQRQYPDRSLPISARTGQGLDELRRRVREILREGEAEVTFSLPLSEGRAIQFVETRGQILQRQYADGQVTYRVRLGRRQISQLRALGASIVWRAGLETGDTDA